MPSRIVCLGILVYWLIAAFYLLTRDLLPELTYGYPPDLRSIVAASRDVADVNWTIEVIDDPKNDEIRRLVGKAVTGSKSLSDGGAVLKSRVTIDSGDLFKGTPFSSAAMGRLQIESHYEVDSKGNLKSLELKVTPEEAPKSLLTVEGRVVDRSPEGRDKDDRQELELTFHSKGLGNVRGLHQVRRFPYEPRSVVGNMFGPMDRLPGLHVGQKWETQMVNPLSGQVDQVRVEVVKRTLIHWQDDTVSTFEVLQSFPPLSSARSWVRTDGVILRQELPNPFLRLILEREQPPRQPDELSKTEVNSP